MACSRKERTKIINKGITMGSDGLFRNEVVKKYELAELVKKKKARTSGWLSEGSYRNRLRPPWEGGQTLKTLSREEL